MEMGKVFKFKREVGYAEMISALAVLLSAFALWKSYQNDEGFIVQGSGTVITADLIADCQHVVTYPIQFHNSGKKAVVLERFTPADIRPVLFSSGGEAFKEEAIKYNLYLHRNYYYFDINEIYATIQNDNELYIKDYKFIGELILPGDTFQAAFVITINKKQKLPKPPKRISIAINTKFGNKQELEYAASISLAPEKFGSCQV
jgi:hypothetical protein